MHANLDWAQLNFGTCTLGLHFLRTDRVHAAIFIRVSAKRMIFGGNDHSAVIVDN